MKINYHPEIIFGAKRESLLGKQILKVRTAIRNLFTDKTSLKSKKIDMNVLVSIQRGGIACKNR